MIMSAVVVGSLNVAIDRLLYSLVTVITRKLMLLYTVIHKYLRDFRTRLRNNQDRHGRKEHINR